MEINGIAHIFLTVSDFEKCVKFYRPLLKFLGMKTIMDFENYLYCVGGRTAVGVTVADKQYAGERFVQQRVGLHHVCFRAREKADVDACYEFLKTLDAKIIHAPEEGPWAPGYYSVLFEDPDGIRLEVNYVPGKGLLDAAEKP